MKKSVGLLAVLLSVSPWASGERPGDDLKPLVSAGEWVSPKAQNIRFTLEPGDYYSGMVVFNCAKTEKKIRLIAVPSGAERIREISQDQPVQWKVKVLSKGGEFTGELIGGGGRLPDLLISPAAPWLKALGEDGDHFNLVIDGTESYQIPTSQLIATTIASCSPPIS